jgi:hypothetical protein
MHYILSIFVLWVSLLMVSFEVTVLFNNTEYLINNSDNCKNEVQGIIMVIGSYFVIVIPVVVITTIEFVRIEIKKLIYIISISTYIFIRIFIGLPFLDANSANQTLCGELDYKYILYIIIGEMCQVGIIITSIILYRLIQTLSCCTTRRPTNIPILEQLPGTDSPTETLVYHTCVT